VKFPAYVGGIGSGKTVAGVNEMIREMVTHPGALNLIMAPTYTMLKQTTMREFFRFCPPELIAQHHRSDQLVTFVNGAECLYLSGEYEDHIERVRSFTLGSEYVDEGSLFPGYVWDILLGRLRDKRGSLRAWVTATPKGYNWMHDCWVRKTYGNPKDYELYTGTTYDNPYTPQEYKDTLAGAYTGSFAKQELLGEFVAFEGLVYPEFSRVTHVKPAAAAYKDLIAGVDWGYTNPSVCLFIGLDYDNRAHILREIYQSGLQPEELIGLVKVENETLLKKYGRSVSTFYCDPSEPMYIQKFIMNGLRAVAGKNDIMPGITEVASRLSLAGDKKPRLTISECCANTINELGIYRFGDGREGKERREEPLKIYDHACFVAGTMIETIDGERPIEDVRVGDLLLTRGGYFPALKTGRYRGKSGVWKLIMSNGRELVGTPDHLIFVIDKGFLSLDALRYSFMLEDANNNVWKQKKLNIKGLCGDDILILKSALQDSIIDVNQGTTKRERGTCIEKSGRIAMAQSLRDVSYITLTGTRQIISPKISSASRLKSIINSQLEIERKPEGIVREYARSLKHGMLLQKAIGGIKNTALTVGKIENQLEEGVGIAARSLMIYPNTVSSVQINANQHGGVGQERITSSEPVQYVERILSQIDTRKSRPVLVSAVENLHEKRKVYNLTVADCPEFYANGVLVHNCDALRYALMGARKSETKLMSASAQKIW